MAGTQAQKKSDSPCSNEWLITPTLSQWQEFWRVCEEIEVWSWPPWIGDRYTIDGLQWVMELEFGNRRVACEGQTYGSPPHMRAKLMRFHRALQAMAGCIEERVIDAEVRHWAAGIKDTPFSIPEFARRFCMDENTVAESMKRLVGQDGLREHPGGMFVLTCDHYDEDGNRKRFPHTSGCL